MRFAPTLYESVPSTEVAGQLSAPLISQARLLELYAALARMSVLYSAAAEPWGVVMAAFLADLTAVDRIVYDHAESATELLAGFMTHSRSPLMDAPASRATEFAMAFLRQNVGAVMLAIATRDRVHVSAPVEALRVAAHEGLPILYFLLAPPILPVPMLTVPTRTRAQLKVLSEQIHWSHGASVEGVATIRSNATDPVVFYRVAFERIEQVRFGSGPTLVDGKETARGESNHDVISRMEIHLGRKGLLESQDRARMTEELLRVTGRVSRTAA